MKHGTDLSIALVCVWAKQRWVWMWMRKWMSG